MERTRTDKNGIIQRTEENGKTIYSALIPNYNEKKPWEYTALISSESESETLQALEMWREQRKEFIKARNERRQQMIREAEDNGEFTSEDKDNERIQSLKISVSRLKSSLQSEKNKTDHLKNKLDNQRNDFRKKINEQEEAIKKLRKYLYVAYTALLLVSVVLLIMALK